MVPESPPVLRGPGLVCMTVTWLEAAVALVLFTLRARTASFRLPEQIALGPFGLRWDFTWVSVAMLLALAAQSLTTVTVRYGLGSHEDSLSYEAYVATMFWSWIAQIVAIFALAVGRIAIISFLLTLQDRTRLKGRWVLYLIGFLQATINVAEAILILHQCSPVQKLWDPRVAGTCDLIALCSKLGFFQGSIGVLADLLLAFYPVYLVGRLRQMKLSLKVGLCLMMGGGVVAGVAGINKTIAIATTTEVDITYAMARLDTWALTEAWFIIIFGSIPVLRPFFVRFSRHQQGHRDSDESTTYYKSPSIGRASTADGSLCNKPRTAEHENVALAQHRTLGHSTYSWAANRPTAKHSRRSSDGITMVTETTIHVHERDSIQGL